MAQAAEVQAMKKTPTQTVAWILTIFFAGTLATPATLADDGITATSNECRDWVAERLGDGAQALEGIVQDLQVALATGDHPCAPDDLPEPDPGQTVDLQIWDPTSCLVCEQIPEEAVWGDYLLPPEYVYAYVVTCKVPALGGTVTTYQVNFEFECLQGTLFCENPLSFCFSYTNNDGVERLDSFSPFDARILCRTTVSLFVLGFPIFEDIELLRECD